MEPPPERGPWLAALVALVALGHGLAALAVALGPGAYSTYLGRGPVEAVAAAAAAIALVLAMLAAASRPAGSRDLWFAAVTSLCWSAPAWAGWADGPGLVRGLGALAAPYLFAVVLHWLLGRRLRPLVVAGYVVATADALGHALLADPSRDPDCWANCVGNVFLVRSAPGAVGVLEVVVACVTAALGFSLVVVSAGRCRRAPIPARWTVWPAGAGGIVMGCAVLLHAALGAARPEKPADAAYDAAFVALAAGVVLVASATVAGRLRAAAQRRRVGQIAAELAESPRPGELEPTLARAVGDPALRVAYWLPPGDGWVDGHGRAVPAPVAGATSRLTTLMRDGQPVATVSHAPSVTDAVGSLGAGAGLAVDNERLRATLLSRAEHVRSSRERIVETADASRRRLERDLHDGAQQRLLALSYHLRLARDASVAEDDAETAEVLAGAVREVATAIDELRELAHGLYPAVLAESGLGPALDSLADTAPVPVSMRVGPSPRLGTPVETAAYFVVRAAMTDAVSRSTSGVDVLVATDDDRLVIAVGDDGSPRKDAMVATADRVGALGGTLVLEPHHVRAVLPCA